MPEEKMYKALTSPEEVCPKLREFMGAAIEDNTVHKFVNNQLVRVSDLPEEFQAVAHSRKFKHFSPGLGNNVNPSALISNDRSFERFEDPREGKAKYQVGRVVENHNHFPDYYRSYYALYRTYVQQTGGHAEERKPFMTYLENHLAELGFQKAKLNASNSIGYPGITFRCLLPLDLRASVVRPITNDASEWDEDEQIAG